MDGDCRQVYCPGEQSPNLSGLMRTHVPFFEGDLGMEGRQLGTRAGVALAQLLGQNKEPSQCWLLRFPEPGEACEMLSPGYGVADVIMNTEQLWLPSQALHTPEERHSSKRGTS